MELPFGGTQASDTFETGTRAAAWGGTTSIIDFAVQRYGERVEEGLATWHAKAAGNACIDYGFHQIIGGVDEFSLKAMDALDRRGRDELQAVHGVPGRLLFRRRADPQGDAEVGRDRTADHDACRERPGDRRPRRAAVLGRKDIALLPRDRAGLADGGGGDASRDHDRQPDRRAALRGARQRQAGGRSNWRRLATRARTSSAKPVRNTSTCRLKINSGAPGFEGAKWVCSTPLRARAEGHQDAMWQALRTNDLQIVSTDHCPFCMKEQKELGLNDFRAIPNGIGGIEHRMDLMYQGVVTGQISLPRWVELTSTTPARDVRPPRQERRDSAGRRCRSGDL